MSNPKSPNHRCTFDAFLSFRGTDTRKGFTDHLYRALEVAGIHTFRDDDEIERGANISAELQKAIQESRVSIIVFSKDYASSRWCLDELVTIMDHRETNEHMVMPIFYDVDPSHVRNQTGIFEEAFARHQQRFNKEMDKVEKWRKALRDVADLGGMVLGDRSKSQFIQEIVEFIGNKLDHTWNRRLRVDPSVVGIDYRVKGLNMWLEDGSTDVGVAVVCGMDGIGKTTIAKTAYNQNFNKFQGSSFLAGIRATSKLPNGLVHLQRNLLADLQKGKAKKIYSLDEGITKIKQAIRCKRVLIALDDVDNLEQFNAILGMQEWLHPGSKIIITTRHEHLLKARENCAIFEVEGLHEYESLELFSWHAFGQPHPGEGYMDLSRPVVQHCGGVPLALQVLGSSLFGKAADVWKNALQNLDVITEGKIQKILRISLDSLQDHDKRLFLHIACFFIGKDKDFSTTVLDECEFATNIGIQNLVDRCLLIIDGFNKLTMHQLLQDMGRGIIREESPEDPGKRTRVWNKDASNVLRKLTGTETIKGLMLNIPMLIKDESSKIISSGSNRKRFHVEDYDGNCSSSRRRLGFFSWQSISSSSTNSFPVSNEIRFKTEAFRRMHNLELLLLDNVQFSGGYEDFPKNLIWLSWRGFSLKSIPTNFYLENLIALDLRNSSLHHVWKGTRFLPRLKILNLSHSHGLVTTPDLSGFPNLKRLILKDCINLKEVDESIGDLEKLVFLNLKDCKNLMKLPIRIRMLRSLQELILSGCSNVVLPTSMIVENQSDSTPSGMKKLSLLSAVVKLWQSIGSWVLPRKNLQLTSASLPQFLKSLEMAYCNLSEIPNDLSSLSSLEYLNLSGNPFLSLPVNMNGLSKLHTLLLIGCTNLEMIPELPPSVETLRAWYCTSLKRVPNMLETIKDGLLTCENLVEMQNVFKTRPLRSVDIEMIKDIGLFNLESIGSTEVEMLNYLTGSTRKGPLQGLDECGIFSIFLPGSEVPDWFCYKSSMGDSELSITIPPHRNLKIRGLNACVVYAQGTILHISNETKGLKRAYMPVTIGLPKEKEHMLWLSHWRFANDELEGGDEIRVSVGNEFDVFIEEFGIQVVYEQNNNEGTVTEDITTMFQHETTTPLSQNQLVAGDVSASASRFHKNNKNKEQLMDTSTAVEASSPTFSSSSSCSFDDETYDVFLSFRGEDTRKTFTDHLYWRLKHARVDVFIDENELRGGEIIPDELNQIIQRSRISVIIFSRRYADSIWCLEELEKIMECRRKLGQIVLPIFYDVDPSDVREQTGSFAEAFQTHEVRFHGVKDKEEKIQSWRKSLTEAADLDGLVFSKIDGYEGVFIRKIIDEINRKLKSTCLGIATKQAGIESSKQEISNYVQVQVGIDSRLQDISTHLDVGGSNDVRIIGIWGMGGMGKTTVAEAIFNKYHPSFDAKSFIQNMRERKLVDLQEQLLFDIFKLTKVEGSSMDDRRYEIKKRLPTRKVLVILDDICHADQLKALAIERDSFGPGSRIVITTRNKHLLEIIEVDKICCLKAMNEVEALELLSLHAFKSRCPNEGYLELSREVVGYCGGLPLALKVLGSSLYERSTIEWRNALDKWKTRPPTEIHKMLKLSYDELPDNYLRDAFLDISCFFIGMDMNYVMQILDRCFSSVKGLSVLLEQSLLTVGEDNKLMMHDLVRDMGREIVRAQSPYISRNRSRLWHHEDVKDVLRNKSGTDKIEGLILDLKESDKPSFSTKAFRRMRRLRLLKLNYVQLTGSYKHFSKELRWFCWHGFPLKVIPKDFYQENLVAIDLSYSKLIRVWEDSHVLLLELKSLDLSHSACLKELPDFSRLPNLKELILRGCKRLLWDQYSMMRRLDKLKLLDLGYCNLTEDKVVRELCFLRSLKILRLDGNGFKSLSLLKDSSELEELTLNDCKNLRQIGDLPMSLKFLKANYCTTLESIHFKQMSNMRELDLKDCRELEYISDLDGSLHFTETIHMEGCTNFSARFKEDMLKGWAVSGGGGLFFSGNDIPSWFTAVVNEDKIIYIDVPNSGIGALTVCIICSSDDSASSGRLSLTVVNRTQRTAFSIFPMTVSGLTPYKDYLWLGRIPNNVLNLKGGDKVHARAEFLREEGKKHLKLKKTGLCLEREFMREGYEIKWESKPYTYLATDDDAWPSKHSHNLIRKTTRKREGRSEDASRRRWFGWFGRNR